MKLTLQAKQAAFLFVLSMVWLGTTGCQRLGRKLLGVEDRPIDRVVNVKTISAPISGDYFVLSDPDFETASALTKRACTVSGVCVDLPFGNSTVVQDRAFLKFYNIQSTFPSCTFVVVEVIS